MNSYFDHKAGGLLMKKSILLIPFTFSAIAAGDFQAHILKPGETISQLLQRKGYTPLYGKNNWVERTLELNHLTVIQANEIKKGFPIFLPGKSEVAKTYTSDKVSVKKASVIRAGLFGNTISDHQKVFLELDYFASEVALKKSNVSLGQNYGLGIRVDGENDYRIGDLTYNYYGSAFIYTHGVGEFEGKDDLASSFTPTYQLNLGSKIQSPELPFNFGPLVRLEEKSKLEENSRDELILRRDRLAWVGIKFAKIFEVDHLIYQASLGYLRKFIGQNLNSDTDFAASQLFAIGKVNLSKDYDMGIKATATSYDNIGIKSENTLGLNFSYNLK